MNMVTFEHSMHLSYAQTRRRVRAVDLGVRMVVFDIHLNLNSLLVKRQIDNPSPGAVTGGN